MNVALTGFMGAGKTTTGRRLARLIEAPFVDSDEEIVRRHGPIQEIFLRHGESVFRRYEAAILGELAAGGPHVIAVGGGAILDPQNRRRLRKGGVIVHLAITARTAWQRVSRRSHRPLLGPQADIDTVSALLAERATAYADCDVSIRVDGRSPAAVAQIIARWYRDQQIADAARP